MNELWLQAFAIVVITLIVDLVERRVYKKLLPKLETSRTVWDDSLLYAMHKPFNVLIWLYGLTFAAEMLRTDATINNVLFDAIPDLRTIGTGVLFVWFLIRFISRIEHAYTVRKKAERLDETTIHALCQILRLAVIITAVLTFLQSRDIPIGGFLAVGGVGGIAVGFAAKDMLVNFFGGLMVFLDRPFSVGDWVRSPDRNIEGTVEFIGWRTTRIRTFDKRPLYVPNGAFLTISVENPSRMTNRRIYTNVGIRYEDSTKLAAIVNHIEDMLREHPEIDSKQTLMVKFVEFGPSSLNFMIYTFSKTTDWVKFQAVQEDVFLKVLEIINQHKAECAFPTRTLHLPEGVSINGPT